MFHSGAERMGTGTGALAVALIGTVEGRGAVTREVALFAAQWQSAGMSDIVAG